MSETTGTGSKPAAPPAVVAAEVEPSRPPRCDVCAYRDGHNGLVLLECTECHLYVHRDCYGMPTYIRKTFQCWACQAKGRTFVVHHPNGREGSRESISVLQAERPRYCDLCGHNPTTGTDTPAQQDSQVHAMHPVYDNYGNKARHLYTTDPTTGKHRLVWAHTLCGFFLATKRLLYATTRQGTTHEGEESDPDDDRSVNPALVDSEDSEGEEEEEDLFQGFAPSHHFVWYRERKWTKLVHQHQLGLTCDICHQSDYSSNTNERIFRIAVQCSANDNTEYAPFRSTHTKSLSDHESCTLAFHVGCARWGAAASSSLRRVYYFPGLPNDDTLEPIQCLYCPLHASDVNVKQSQQRQIEDDTQHQLARQKRKRNMMEQYGVLPLTLDQYSVHESTAEQQEAHERQPTLYLLDRMKQDLGTKVRSVTRDNSQEFIKEQKILWQRIALAEDVDQDFSKLWKLAKAHANQVWKEHQAEQEEPLQEEKKATK